MERKNKIIISMGIIIILLIGALIIPKVTEGFKEKYRGEGYNICMTNTINNIVTDLQNLGYTSLVLGNQTIKLGVIP